MTEEDKIEIKKMIYEEITKSFLTLPEIVVKMMNQRSAMVNLVKEFYAENPEWQKHTDIVQSVMEQIESDNPGLSPQEVVNKAKSEIKKRLTIIGSVSLKPMEKPKDYSFKGTIGNFGEI